MKRGTSNELTRYRYDVVLHIGEATPLAPQPGVAWQDGDHSIAEIEAQLASGRFTSAIIRNVANRRLAGDLAGMRQLWSADDRQRVGTLRESLVAEEDYGTDPEDFWALADKGLCDVSISWPPHANDGRFDVTLSARGTAPRRQDPTFASAAPPRLTTDPLEAAYRQQLGLELHQILRDSLPEASVPVAVFAVEALPPGAPAVIDFAPKGVR